LAVGHCNDEFELDRDDDGGMMIVKTILGFRLLLRLLSRDMTPEQQKKLRPTFPKFGSCGARFDGYGNYVKIAVRGIAKKKEVDSSYRDDRQKTAGRHSFRPLSESSRGIFQ
jgi:hypothetical protein